MRFTGMRIDGFKSFADAAELPLPGGLVGVIGQNGTGKSNVTEALRWMMGGVSARALRAGDMASVIFGGADRRAARSWAEVALTIEDDAKTLPAPWTGQTLTASRKVVRGRNKRGQDAPTAVSTYRVNDEVVTAAEARAIFAAAGTGSGSAALVRQGRIAELIAARAQDRRSLLEEAAGVVGVDVRRREADRRLLAAERDLARYADLATELTDRRGQLAEQAERARVYAALTVRIEAARAAAAGLAIVEAELQRYEAEKFVGAADDELSKAEVAAEAAKAVLAAAIQVTKQDWRRQAEAAKQVEAAETALRGVEAALAGAERDHARLGAQAAGLERDVARESALATEAEAQTAALTATLEEIGAKPEESDGPTIDGLTAAKQQAEAALRDARKTLEGAVTIAAQDDGERKRIAERLKEAKLDVIDARSRLRAAEATLADLPEGETALPEELASLQEASTAAAHEVSVAQAERAALGRLVGQADGDDGTAGIEIEPGYEAALIAALGDGAGRTWTALGEDPSAAPNLPSGVQPLSVYVTAPPELARRLSLIGVLSDAFEAGNADCLGSLLAGLVPGQVIVSREGRCWSWDGSVTEAGSAGAAGQRLANRRRLDEIDAALPGLRTAVEEAKAEAKNAHKRSEQAQRYSEAIAAADAARDHLAKMTEREEGLRLAPPLVVGVPGQPQDLETVRAQVASAEETALRAAQALTQAQAEDQVRAERVRAAVAERSAWQERAEAARQREADARSASEAAVVARDEAATMPSALAPQRADLARALDAARTEHHKIRQAGESARADMREAEIARGLATTARDVAKAKRNIAAKTSDEAAAAVTQVAAEAAELHGTSDRGELLAAWRDCTDKDEAEADTLPTKAETLRAERKAEANRTALGAVNQAAAEELDELDARLAAMTERCADVEGATRALRRITGELEDASRKRVAEAFDVVAANFERLLIFLFGGGEARLELVGDDPLEAGLEVMAQPPGKQLTSLSLLSGGEQTLTALALIMAVFQARPAPVCVLDEVDAPLDQRNTERYCRLLEAVSADAPDTTFLVVTHHPVTTAAMDYLCAVSMDEPGVTSLRIDAVPGRGAEKAERGRAA